MSKLASLSLLPLLAAGLIVAGCGGDESGPEEGHTPHDAALFVDGVDVTQNLPLIVGEAVRVEVRFLNEAGEEITGIEDDHHAALRFTPQGMATTANVAGANFQKDVTASGTPATGLVSVGYGHDEPADELEFGPFEVTAAAP
jgi:hypothetical protein